MRLCSEHCVHMKLAHQTHGKELCMTRTDLATVVKRCTGCWGPREVSTFLGWLAGHMETVIRTGQRCTKMAECLHSMYVPWVELQCHRGVHNRMFPCPTLSASQLNHKSSPLVRRPSGQKHLLCIAPWDPWKGLERTDSTHLCSHLHVRIMAHVHPIKKIKNLKRKKNPAFI